MFAGEVPIMGDIVFNVQAIFHRRMELDERVVAVRLILYLC